MVAAGAVLFLDGTTRIITGHGLFKDLPISLDPPKGLNL
jgi:hypothetical protein